MRIIGGTHRGTVLANVGKGDAGAHLRPTTDRVRENLCNDFQGGRFGETISREIDQGRAALALLRANIATCHAKDHTKILARDARRPGPAGAPANLIFLDPPYGQNLGLQALMVALSKGWLAPGALIVWEESAAQIAPAGFNLLDQRRYGDTWVSFMRHDA